MDKTLLQNRLQLLYDEMVKDAVSEIPSEYLSFNGIIHDKRDTLADFVRTIYDLLIELDEVGFVIKLELQSVYGISFVAATAIVCGEKICEVHLV